MPRFRLLNFQQSIKINKVGISSAQFCAVYKDQQLIDRPCFNLPRRECDLVIAGISTAEYFPASTRADITRVLDEVEIDSAEFSAQYTDPTGRAPARFHLPRRECDLIIAGYSAKYRLALIDRWQELESKNLISLPNFSTPETDDL